MKERAERRRYASDRAGASGRAFARERLWAYTRARWKVFPTFILVAVAPTPVIWFGLSAIPEMRGFALGAYLAAVLGWLYHWAVIASGAASSTMGMEGEQWTDQELARLGPEWRIINHVTFRASGDIDHIAIGPDGVIVIETKWTSDTIKLDGRDRWLERAFDQASENATLVAKVLGWGARSDRPVSPLVVVWGPQVQPASDELFHDDRGVNAIAGRHLRRTLEDLGDTERLDAAERERIYEVIRSHVDRRDRHDAALRGPVRPPIEQVVTDWSLRTLVALVAYLVSAQSLRIGLPAFCGVQTATLVAAAMATQRETLRRFAWAWIVGSQAVTVLVAAYALTELLT